MFKACHQRMIFLLQIEEMVRIYGNSKYLGRNVRWLLFILAEYILYSKEAVAYVLSTLIVLMKFRYSVIWMHECAI